MHLVISGCRIGKQRCKKSFFQTFPIYILSDIRRCVPDHKKITLKYNKSGYLFIEK